MAKFAAYQLVFRFELCSKVYRIVFHRDLYAIEWEHQLVEQKTTRPRLIALSG